VNKNNLKRMSRADLVAHINTIDLRIEELETTQADYQQRFERLLEKDEVYRTLLDESSDPIFMFYPDGTYRYVNIAFADGVGKPQDQIIGRKISDVFPPDEAEKRFSVMRWVFENGKIRVFEVRVPRSNGDRYYITTVKPILDEQKKVISVICISKEITERKRLEDELLHLSTHDALTNVYNRHFFHTEMERIANSRLYPICIVMIDLDSLKVVNDSQGHKAGDAYIQKAAALLKSCLRSEDILARIGGDEFVILLPQTSQIELMNILARLKTEIKNQGNPLFNLSIGWAIGEKGCSLDNLMQQADARMYKEKSLHKP
jgi:diguanylate cyclase (GGDEF)-like protein/PAS domain S-box-containing protein